MIAKADELKLKLKQGMPWDGGDTLRVKQAARDSIMPTSSSEIYLQPKLRK